MIHKCHISIFVHNNSTLQRLGNQHKRHSISQPHCWLSRPGTYGQSGCSLETAFIATWKQLFIRQTAVEDKRHHLVEDGIFALHLYSHQCAHSDKDELISPYCRIYASVNWVSISSGNGLSPVRHQAIIWTNTGLLSIGLLGTIFNKIRIAIRSFSFKKMHLKLSSAKIAAILSRGLMGFC